jgi:steroid 5-alpha reductase family enzyme
VLAVNSAAIPITISLAATIVLFLSIWLISLAKRDVGMVDIAWGPGFALIAWLEWLWAAPSHLSATLLLLAVTIWAARLGAHLFVRHRMSTAEDPRYAAMRAAAPDRFWWQSLYKVFVLQAVILWALALPIHLAMTTDRTSWMGWLTKDAWPGWLTVIGLILFTGGFMLEAVADRALLHFRRDPANRGRLITSGVFAWSRHPNYFGECALWFGIGLMAWDASGNPLAMLGPVALTALILKVSGIPLLEDHLRRTRPEFAAYAARTSAFIPWPPKRS